MNMRAMSARRILHVKIIQVRARLFGRTIVESNVVRKNGIAAFSTFGYLVDSNSPERMAFKEGTTIKTKPGETSSVHAR